MTPSALVVSVLASSMFVCTVPYVVFTVSGRACVEPALARPRNAIGYCWHGKAAWRVKSGALVVEAGVTREEHRASWNM
jgi:hypothetical protein